MATFLAIFMFVFVALFAVTAYIAVRFAKRALQMQDLLTEIDNATNSLVEYCETLKSKSLLYHSPEVMQFHKLVIAMANPLDKIRNKTKELV